MNRTIARRVAATAAVALVSFGVPTGPASATKAFASSAASWLDDQLTDGAVVNQQYGSTDYGLSLDIFFALDTLGTDATSIIDRLARDPGAYVTGDAYGDTDSLYAGSAGKLAAAALVAGRDATRFGGRDLVADVEGAVLDDGAETGRAKDKSTYGDYSNAIGQSWVVRALALADSQESAAAVDYLLLQQCDNGSVREQMAAVPCGGGSGNLDTTSFAAQALMVAREKGATGLNEPIDRALDWLLSCQAANGSFSDNAAANTNSTGLAAITLATAGRTGTVDDAGAWIVRHQVTATTARGTKLKGEIGAIAYDKAALSAGKKEGITKPMRDQWVRATAQAAPATAFAQAVAPSRRPTPAKPPAGSSGAGSARPQPPVPSAMGGGARPQAESAPAPTPTPAPVLAPTPGPGGDADDSRDLASDTGDGAPPLGWFVAGGAGILMLATGGAVGIGQLMRGRHS